MLRSSDPKAARCGSPPLQLPPLDSQNPNSSHSHRPSLPCQDQRGRRLRTLFKSNLKVRPFFLLTSPSLGWTSRKQCAPLADLLVSPPGRKGCPTKLTLTALRRRVINVHRNYGSCTNSKNRRSKFCPERGTTSKFASLLLVCGIARHDRF